MTRHHVIMSSCAHDQAFGRADAQHKQGAQQRCATQNKAHRRRVRTLCRERAARKRASLEDRDETSKATTKLP